MDITQIAECTQEQVGGFDRAELMDFVELISIQDLEFGISGLGRRKEQLEKNPDEAAEQIQIYTDKIEIYRRELNMRWTE